VINNDLLNLYQTLINLKGLSGVRFCYGVVKNINLLKPEVEAIQKTIEPKEEFQEYEKERIELAQKYSKKAHKIYKKSIKKDFKNETI